MSDPSEVFVRLVDGMHFEAHAVPDEAALTFHLDTREDFGGQGLGVRPQSVLLVSLAGCTGMDVLSILRKKRQAVTGFEVRVSGDRADEHPKVFTHIRVHYVVSGQGVEPAAVERAIELSMTKYCPVSALLQQVVPVDTSYEIVETEG